MSFLWLLIGLVVLVWVISLFKDAVGKRPITEEERVKHIHQSVADLGKAVGCKSIQGMRSHMEDSYQSQYCLNGERGTNFFAVYDGHGGARTSAFAAKKLHRMLAQALLIESPVEALNTAFHKLDHEWLLKATKESLDDGSTAVGALVVDHILYVANVGDSRCVLSRQGRAVDMSHDHKPIREDEKQRVLAAGGKVIHYGTWRVEGVLAVSRAFGDRRLKKYVIADPEIKQRDLDEKDDFLILATDGVWDVLSSQAAVDIVAKADTPQLGAAMLTDAAYNSGSMDNITALVVDMKHFTERR